MVVIICIVLVLNGLSMGIFLIERETTEGYKLKDYLFLITLLIAGCLILAGFIFFHWYVDYRWNKRAKKIRKELEGKE
jgi:prolipoprotein diacylglyceryltransferase